MTAIRHSLDQLRENGEVDYAYLGVSSQAIWPQLADELDLGAEDGALIAEVVEDGPADKAGIKGGGRESDFQATPGEDRRRRDHAVNGQRGRARERLQRADHAAAPGGRR